MEPTLEEDLVAADGDHLGDLPHQHVAVENIALGMLRRPVEGAEVTHRRADVGVVDITVDVVGAIRLRMEPRRDGVGGPTDRGQIRRLEKDEGVGGGQPLSGDGVGQDAVDGWRHGGGVRGGVGPCHCDIGAPGRARARSRSIPCGARERAAARSWNSARAARSRRPRS